MCWRDGMVLVTRRVSTLPPHCVKCGKPAVEQKNRTFYWHHSLLDLLAFGALLLYLIVALIVRKKATVSVGLCAEHRSRRLRGFVVSWGIVLAGIGVAILGVSMQSCGVMGAGALVLLGGIITGMFMTRVLLPERIDHDFARLRGCGEAFLAMLPDFNG